MFSYDLLIIVCPFLPYPEYRSQEYWRWKPYGTRLGNHPGRDHPGRVQGCESVCWGVLGTPYLNKLLDWETYKDFTIVKFAFLAKKVGGADRFGPTQNSNIFIQKSLVFQTYVWFKKDLLMFFILRDYQNTYFLIFEISEISKIPQCSKIPPLSTSVFTNKGGRSRSILTHAKSKYIHQKTHSSSNIFLIW